MPTRHTAPTTPTPLTRRQCLDLVAGAPYGRVVFTVDALPAVAPVPFILDGERIFFDVPSRTALARASRNGVLAFHVDYVDATDGTGWTVTLTGPTAHVVAEPPDLPTLQVVLTPVVVAGSSVRVSHSPVEHRRRAAVIARRSGALRARPSAT